VRVDGEFSAVSQNTKGLVKVAVVCKCMSQCGWRGLMHA